MFSLRTIFILGGLLLLRLVRETRRSGFIVVTAQARQIFYTANIPALNDAVPQDTLNRVNYARSISASRRALEQ